MVKDNLFLLLEIWLIADWLLVVGALLQWITKASNLLDGDAVRNVKTPLTPWHLNGLSNTIFGDFNVHVHTSY